MGFGDFFEQVGGGFTKPFVWGYDHILKPTGDRFDKISGLPDKVLNGAGAVLDDIPKLADGIAGLLSGNNLIYIGAFTVAAIYLLKS